MQPFVKAAVLAASAVSLAGCVDTTNDRAETKTQTAASSAAKAPQKLGVPPGFFENSGEVRGM